MGEQLHQLYMWWRQKVGKSKACKDYDDDDHHHVDENYTYIIKVLVL